MIKLAATLVLVGGGAALAATQTHTALAGVVVVLVVTLLMSAFFSGMEIAYFSASRFRAELLRSRGSTLGKLTAKYLQNPARFLSTILIGNNLVVVTYGIYSAKLVTPWLTGGPLHLDPETNELSMLLVQTLISTLALLILAEYLPKTLFASQPDSMLTRGAGVMELFYRLLKPVVWLVEHITGFLLRKIGSSGGSDNGVRNLTKADLYQYLQEHFQEVADSPASLDAEIFTNALAFNEIRVREFMVPRTDIHALDIEDGLEKLRELFIGTEHSRVLIYQDDLDNVLGYVHIRELFRQPNTLQALIQPILMVPESMPANNLLAEFHAKKRTIALVVDEFGGTAGLVTIEDLVEVVFGDILDEHDDNEEDEMTEQQLGPNEYLFSGRMEIDDLNRKYELELPEGEYATLGGLLMHLAEHIPRKKEVFYLPPYEFKVEEASQNRVELVRVFFKPHETP